MILSKSTTETAYEFLQRIVKEATPEMGCLIWPYTKNSWGYGHVKIAGKQQRVNRIAFEIFYGHPPKNQSCHTCDVRNCFNPYHLFDGTAKENCQDASAKGRTLFGSKNACAILTEDVVRKIKAELNPRVFTYKMAAKKYGVSYGTINDIVTRSWRHII